jgi:type I restriction enzyme S subunit
MSANGDGGRPVLPEGWEWRELADIGTWVGGGTPSKQREEFWERGTIPWVSPKDMKSWRLDSTQDAISEAGVGGSSAKVFAANSVAVVVRSGILEHTLPVALVPFMATANQDMRVVTPNEEIDAEWLMYALQAHAETIRRACRKDGTTVASIDVPKLTAWSLPVPPIDEQRWMVALIEHNMASIETGVQTLRQCASLAAHFRSSLLQRLASVDTPMVRIDDVGEVFVGATPSRTDPSLWDGEVNWVSSGEVAFSRIAATRERISETALGNWERRLHPPGTVLMAMIGEGKTRGQVAILEVPAAHNQNSAAIRVDRRRMVPEFLFYCLMRQYDQNRRVGSGSQQPALNGGLVKAVRVPCPPIDDQRRAVAKVDAGLALVRRVDVELGSQVRRAKQLARATLAATFRGDLRQVEKPAGTASAT